MITRVKAQLAVKQGLVALCLLCCSMGKAFSNDIVDYTIPSGTWQLMTFPGIHNGSTTVRDYFMETADLSPDNLWPDGSGNWVIYEYDAFGNRYVVVDDGDILKPGVGYWVAQVTGSDATIVPPEFAFIGGYKFRGNGLDGCETTLCSFAFLSGERGTNPFSDPQGDEFRLLGNTSANSVDPSDILGFVGGGTSHNFAADVVNAIWVWDSSANGGGYVNDRAIPVWNGFWVMRKTFTGETLGIAIPTTNVAPAACPAECVSGVQVQVNFGPPGFPGSSATQANNRFGPIVASPGLNTIDKLQFIAVDSNGNNLAPLSQITLSAETPNNASCSINTVGVGMTSRSLSEREFNACVNAAAGLVEYLTIPTPSPPAVVF